MTDPTERGYTRSFPVTPETQAAALTEAMRRNPPKLRFTRGMAKHAAAMEGRTPPYPTVTLGRGRWFEVIRLLRRDGTKSAARLADQIERQIHDC